jgi:hypothetical protein
VYIKRGIQGRLKSAADDIGDQFSPGNTNTRLITHVASNTLESFDIGESRSTLLADETTTVFGNTEIINAEREFWGRGPAF